MARQATASLLSRFHHHTQTHHARWDSSGRVIGPSQRPLPDNILPSQETHIHDNGGIRTRNPKSERQHTNALHRSTAGVAPTFPDIVIKMFIAFCNYFFTKKNRTGLKNTTLSTYSVL